MISNEKLLFVSYQEACQVRMSINTMKQHLCDYLTACGYVLAFGCLASARLLHTHSTVGETPPDIEFAQINFERATTNEDRAMIPLEPIKKMITLHSHSLTHSPTDRCKSWAARGPRGPANN